MLIFLLVLVLFTIIWFLYKLDSRDEYEYAYETWKSCEIKKKTLSPCYYNDNNEPSLIIDKSVLDDMSPESTSEVIPENIEENIHPNMEESIDSNKPDGRMCRSGSIFNCKIKKCPEGQRCKSKSTEYRQDCGFGCGYCACKNVN